MARQGPSAFTATVWGNGKKALLASALAGKLKEGEEECMICRGDVPASVGLKPCGHVVCYACVENMRARNIFKMDKGVKCPFCRQYIEQYTALKGSAASAAVRGLLDEANRAAAIAAAARNPEQAVQQQQPAPILAQPEPSLQALEEQRRNWPCSGCGHADNEYWRDICSKCRQPNKAKLNKPLQSVKDLMKAGTSEIINMMNEKLHPVLNKALLEAGMPYINGRVSGDRDSILTAMRHRGEERLLRVIKLATEGTALKDCSTHFYGNYSVQDLLEATAKMREACTGSNSRLLDGFRARNGGLDPFGVLHRCVSRFCMEIATHAQGTYVIQRMIELSNGQEALTIGRIVFKKATILGCDTRGVFVVLKAVKQLEWLCWGASDYSLQTPALDLIADLCNVFVRSPTTIFMCHHGLSSQIVISTVQTGLPRFPAIKLVLLLSGKAGELSSVKTSINTVIQLLGLQPNEPSCDIILRDMVCNVALSLQGSFASLMLGEDPYGRQLVELLLARLAEEQEIGWLDAVLQELIGKGDDIMAHKEASAVLSSALGIPILDADSRAAHLSQLSQLVSKKVMTSVERDVAHHLEQQGTPPPPKYFAPCFLQPELSYLWMRGVPLPKAPPPPSTPSPAAAAAAAARRPEAAAIPPPAAARGPPKAADDDSSFINESGFVMPLPFFSEPATEEVAANGDAGAESSVWQDSDSTTAEAPLPVTAEPLAVAANEHGYIYPPASVAPAAADDFGYPPHAEQLAPQPQQQFGGYDVYGQYHQVTQHNGHDAAYHPHLAQQQQQNEQPGHAGHPDYSQPPQPSQLQPGMYQYMPYSTPAPVPYTPGGVGYAEEPAAATGMMGYPGVSGGMPLPPYLQQPASYSQQTAAASNMEAIAAGVAQLLSSPTHQTAQQYGFQYNMQHQPPPPPPQQQPQANGWQPASTAAAPPAQPNAAAAASRQPPSQRGQAAANGNMHGRPGPAAAQRPAAAAQRAPTTPPVTAALAPVASPASWSCSICTYEHAGPEAAFLACAMCGAERGAH